MKISSFCTLFIIFLSGHLSSGSPPAAEAWNQRCIQATVHPIHPGEPGERPFWTHYSRRFIYAPAFSFKPHPRARAYRLSAQSDSTTFTFKAQSPWVPLSPIWLDLPYGKLDLTVMALDKQGEVIDTVGTRQFLKSMPFQGIEDPVYSYRQSSLLCLEDLFLQDKIQTWLETGQPNPEYPLWVHPTKIIGAVINGMSAYSRYTADSLHAAQASQIAKSAADFLQTMCQPAGSSLEVWPPTYWDGVPRGSHPVYMEEIMTQYPAEGAMAFLDLFDLTQDSTYYRAAVRIADTYVATQSPEGTWAQLLQVRDGTPATTNLLIPTLTIQLFDRLESYGVNRFQQPRENAFHWCRVQPMKTYNWQAQFEDTRPQPPYKNMSRREAVDMAILLLDQTPLSTADRDAALELLRYAEDQFVVWDGRDPAARHRWFKKDSKWNGVKENEESDWFTPATLEQYKFYTPINHSSASMIRGYMKAYQVTGDTLFHAKAKAIANALTRAQAFHGGGELPTHMRERLPELNWLNCSTFTAITLYEWADRLEDQSLQAERK